MPREATPVWIKRRIKRHLAKGKNDEASIKLLSKSAALHRKVECPADLPDNVIPFPEIARRKVEGLMSA
jgi:hypothetical protein